MKRNYAYSLIALAVLTSSALIKADVETFFDSAKEKFGEKTAEVSARVNEWRKESPYGHPIKTTILEMNDRFGVLEEKASKIRKEQSAERLKEKMTEVASEIAQAAQEAVEEQAAAVKETVQKAAVVVKEKAEEKLSEAVQEITSSTQEESKSYRPVQWVKDNPKKMIGIGGTMAVLAVVWIVKRNK